MIFPIYLEDPKPITGQPTLEDHYAVTEALEVVGRFHAWIIGNTEFCWNLRTMRVQEWRALILGRELPFLSNDGGTDQAVAVLARRDAMIQAVSGYYRAFLGRFARPSELSFLVNATVRHRAYAHNESFYGTQSYVLEDGVEVDDTHALVAVPPFRRCQMMGITSIEVTGSGSGDSGSEQYEGHEPVERFMPDDLVNDVVEAIGDMTAGMTNYNDSGGGFTANIDLVNDRIDISTFWYVTSEEEGESYSRDLEGEAIEPAEEATTADESHEEIAENASRELDALSDTLADVSRQVQNLQVIRGQRSGVREPVHRRIRVRVNDQE